MLECYHPLLAALLPCSIKLPKALQLLEINKIPTTDTGHSMDDRADALVCTETTGNLITAMDAVKLGQVCSCISVVTAHLLDVCVGPICSTLSGRIAHFASVASFSCVSREIVVCSCIWAVASLVQPA